MAHSVAAPSRGDKCKGLVTRATLRPSGVSNPLQSTSPPTGLHLRDDAMSSEPTMQPKPSGTKVFLGVCVVIVLLVLLGAIVAQSVLPADRLPTLDTVKVQTELPERVESSGSDQST